MKITIEFNLSEEQYDAMAAYTEQWNGESGQSTIAERLAEDAVAPFVASKVAVAYSDAVNRLGEAASSLPYEERKALIEQIESQLSRG